MPRRLHTVMLIVTPHPDSAGRTGIHLRAQRRSRRAERQQGQQQGHAALGRRPPAPVCPSRYGRVFSAAGGRLTAAGELLITSQRFRDAGRNVADCLEKLRVMLLAAAHTPKPRRPTRPSRGSVERRLQAKRQQSHSKARRRLPREES